MDGERNWARSGLALITAMFGAIGLLAGTGLSSAQASSPSAPSQVTTLTVLVAQAKAKERSLLVQVQRVRERLLKERAEISQARTQLATMIATEYTGAPNGMLEVLASSSLNDALDTQITLARLATAEKQSLGQLTANLKAEQRDQALLSQEQSQAAITAARLQAEEIAAAFQAANPPPPPSPAPTSAPTIRPGPHSKPTAPTTAPITVATPAPTPVATPRPVATPTPVTTPAPVTSTVAAGPFTTSTNLTQPSGITLAQIQEFLQGTPLEADAGYFLQAEAATHVSAIYLVSDAVLETGFGTSQLYLVKHNLFGFQAYDVNPFGDGATFPSDQACIAFVSWYVSVYYLTPPGSQVPNQGSQGGDIATGQFYNGPTASGMNVDYASDPLWAAKIAAIGDQLQAMPA
ncbi:MAG TPA: glucosaminidase domain-containing protein [Candidatus Nanopelagicaceae bacterium]|nr:glucosaminidase domain-containing protein [Candidatus Nanopelagicaceae bacterium]